VNSVTRILTFILSIRFSAKLLLERDRLLAYVLSTLRKMQTSGRHAPSKVLHKHSCGCLCVCARARVRFSPFSPISSALVSSHLFIRLSCVKTSIGTTRCIRVNVHTNTSQYHRSSVLVPMLQTRKEWIHANVQPFMLTCVLLHFTALYGCSCCRCRHSLRYLLLI